MSFSAVEKSLLNHNITVRQGAYLPHWTLDEATYAVCFRLADSLPQHAVEQYRHEREALLAEAKSKQGALTAAQRDSFDHLFSEKIESYLDAGHGACWLRQPRIATCVADTLRHFDGERYRLAAWCVMPNHVHAVVQPLGAASLHSVLKSWKGFSASAANKLLGRHGEFWQPETYDHLVRDETDFVHHVRYTLANPAKAGLRQWKWAGASPEAMALVARLS